MIIDGAAAEERIEGAADTMTEATAADVEGEDSAEDEGEDDGEDNGEDMALMMAWMGMERVYT